MVSFDTFRLLLTLIDDSLSSYVKSRLLVTILIAISVTAYSTHSAVLTLEHSFPKGSDISVLVDVQLLLSTMTSNQTRIGEWVNVVGYLTPAPPGTRAKGTTHEPRIAAVQALMLWSAGPLNLQRYEASFATT